MLLDINCDLGEGCPLDAELMPLITSANVACGGHAGGLGTSLRTVSLALAHGVQVGAHPGFLDREHFGRRELIQSPEQTYRETFVQIGTLLSVAEVLGAAVRYVKPHGALYNMACQDEEVARPVVSAAGHFKLPVVGLPGSRLESVCAGRVPFIPEGFADRRYQPDGSLVPRDQPGAFVEDPDEAVGQTVRLLEEGRIRTLCVHGDNPQALAFVRALRQALLRHGVTLRAFSA